MFQKKEPGNIHAVITFRYVILKRTSSHRYLVEYLSLASNT